MYIDSLNTPLEKGRTMYADLEKGRAMYVDFLYTPLEKGQPTYIDFLHTPLEKGRPTYSDFLNTSLEKRWPKKEGAKPQSGLASPSLLRQLPILGMKQRETTLRQSHYHLHEI